MESFDKPLIFTFKLLRIIPLLTVMAIMFYSVWCYVYIYCGKVLNDNTNIKFINLLFYFILLIMLIWCYYKVVMTPPTYIPKQFYLSTSKLKKIWLVKNDPNQVDEILNKKIENLPIRTYTTGGHCRYCKECGLVKPDRTHHCRTCGGCIPKMDHHCPWMNNCISFSNYKFFIQFLSYGVLYSIFILLTMIYSIVNLWTDMDIEEDNISIDETTRYHCTALFVASFTFLIAFGLLLLYHFYLMTYNRTTLEAYRDPLFIYGQDKYGFDLGIQNNFRQVFGSDILLWFIPIFSSLGNGWSFPSRKLDEEKGHYSDTDEDINDRTSDEE